MVILFFGSSSWTHAVRRAWTMFFFFQAEDGIRDLTVTGVQTCALPISTDGAGQVLWTEQLNRWVVTGQSEPETAVRSEERRVGKECRSRGWTYHYEKKMSELYDSFGVYVRIVVTVGGVELEVINCDDFK